MAALSTIRMAITLKSKAFNKNLKKSSKNVKSFSKDLGFLKKAVIGMTAVLGTKIAAGSILEVFNERRGVIDKVGKFADELGFTTEKLTSLQFAAKLTGTNVQILNKGVQIFIRRLGEAKQGTGEARKGIKRLGLTVDELTKMSTNDAFQLVATRINRLSTQAEKAGISFMFFSRQGQDLLNLFQLGFKGFKDIEELVESFGGALSRFETKKVEEMNDSFERFALVMDIAKDRIIATVAPAIDFLLRKLQDLIRPIVFLDKNVDTLTLTLIKFQKPLSITFNLIKAFVTGITGALNTFVAVSALAISTVAELISRVTGPKFKESLLTLSDFFENIQGQSAAKARKSLEKLKKIFADIEQSNLFDSLLTGVGEFNVEVQAMLDANKITDFLAEAEKQAKKTIKALNFKQVVREFAALSDASSDLSFLTQKKDEFALTAKQKAFNAEEGSKAGIIAADVAKTLRAKSKFGGQLIEGLMGPIAPAPSSVGTSMALAGQKQSPGGAAARSLGMSALAFGANPAGAVGHGAVALLEQIVRGMDTLVSKIEDVPAEQVHQRGMPRVGLLRP